MKLTFFGTGTSLGVPIVGCTCPVCTSKDPRDKRFRASALFEADGLNILVDCGPDFRSQMLRAGIGHLDAILFTHNHKDHTGGIDDVRSLNYIDKRAAEIYCEQRVLESLQREYPYAFTSPRYPGAPEWHIHLIENKPFAVHPNKEDRELVWVHDVGYHYGKDRTGIIYNVTKILFENNVNVLDIKQTIVDGYFNMMTIADVTKSKTLNKVKKALEEYGKKASLSINFQLEDAFLAMHNL